MHYRHRIPRPPLDSFIESIWVFQNDRAPHALERILPTGAGQLIVNLKEDQTRLYDPECPDKPYGHRNAGVIDRNGVTWWIGAPVRQTHS